METVWEAEESKVEERWWFTDVRNVAGHQTPSFSASFSSFFFFTVGLKRCSSRPLILTVNEPLT